MSRVLLLNLISLASELMLRMCVSVDLCGRTDGAVEEPRGAICSGG